ncbi:hypothetical protein HK096_008327, partial [Nowakowskiella sp. JEL0078]
MTLIVCNEQSHYETKEFLEKKLLMVKNALAAIGVNHHEEEEDLPLALIIDGRTLDFALEPSIASIFLELATLCKSVLCCRVSPLQKALVVKLVKKNIDDSITLAIGDGANDVGMIQAAHVGIGISGMEGLQAARSADFAIAQFRFLRKLLLVHGGWSYSRLSKVILYSFYKNITMYLIQLWFAFNNGFSGQTLFESWILACYNVIFAVFQPIAIGIFDQFVSAHMLNRYPQLYQLGQRSQFYNHRAFWTWILNTFFHSLLMFMFFIWIYGETTILSDGRSANLWLFGSMVYTANVIVITMKASVISDLWVKFTYLAIFSGVVLWFVVFPIYSTVAPLIPFSEELNGIVVPMFTNSTFWFAILLVSITALLRDITWKYVKHQFFPESYHIVQEIQKFNIPDNRPRMAWFRKAVHK